PRADGFSSAVVMHCWKDVENVRSPTTNSAQRPTKMAKRNAICFGIMPPVIAAPKMSALKFAEVYEGQRFDLRFFRPFRPDLSIKKSSSFFPLLIAATSQRGFAPRPAQVSPDELRYFGGTFLPLNALPPGRPRRTLSPPSKAILSNCLCNWTRCSRSL